ncbi:fumarylacetoacetate hydrolase family protein [Actinocrinis puniceicyclus]|uniref:Fumarylacetoacetate hydrolase family protein n=1 Tax=Actinocrinis puniceicyclus TaxID=977794 RepID=A0A8J7WRR8_9ACTN|nr:fumarylacetoacetate hydrolase family protein [Actinocrinis puniceicyclus]MBS2964365.1 fumarylacetoacetate hydrolase family protein [Actinocrinis puniceicyclus]
MKLLRIGEPGRERPHVALDGGLVLDVSDLTADYTPQFLAGGGLDRLRAEVVRRAGTGAGAPVPEGARVGAPIPRPGKIVCIGLNYADHAAETGAAIPAEPVVFMKAPDTFVGPRDEVRIPRGSAKTDYEVELGVVIGSRARYLESAAAGLAAVAGYLVCNDVSEREFQLERGGTWDKGKSCETFNPAGPYLVTADEVPDPGGLDLWLDVNGQRRQSSNTKNLIFGVGELIRYVSQFMVLEPGDLINTGTPGGVALATGRPEDYLKPGDVVELGITGLGAQRVTFVAAP